MENEERVTVDDALIITDIDKLIKTLSAQKKISISQLQRATGMDRATIEKWIEALEDEGYVRVEHKITDKEVMWLNEVELPVQKEEHKPTITQIEKRTEQEGRKTIEQPIDTLDLSLLEEREIQKEETDEIEGESIVHNSLDRLEDDGAKERVNLIMKKLDEEESEDIKSEETESLEGLENSKDEKVEEKEWTKATLDHTMARKENVRKTSIFKDDHEYETARAKDAEETSIKKRYESALLSGIKERVSQTLYAEDSKKNKVRQTISKYMNEINKQKSEIENLKREKERIYREQYLSLESKAEADFSVLTEKILEKEGRVLELKERILELPIRLEEVEKMRRSLAQIEQEGRKVLTSVSDRVGKFLDETKKSEANVYKKIDESRIAVERAHQKLSELRELSTVADRRVEELRAKTIEIELQTEELNKAMRDMLTELEEATEMKVEITEIEHRVRSAVDKKEEELEALVIDLEEIKKLEQWVNEYLSDYDKKVDEIESYASSSEAELDNLRELAEAEHLKKYLKSLDKLTREYQSEMNGVIEEQQSVDSRIDDAKARLNNLISESQGLIRKLQTETSSIDEFTAAAGKTKERLEGIRKTVEEKAKERDKLKEDSGKTKKKRKEKKEHRKKGRKR